MENTQLAKISYTEDQVKLIKSQVAPNATDSELQMFLYQCKRTGLDALTRQIYCIHRGGKMTIQTSIDGFRVIAERSGDYAGQDEPIFNEQDGKIISCKVTVYRFKGDLRYPAAVGVAYMAEYNAGNTMWNKMPHTMLAKCAEALALRKAYPQDLSGLYTTDEMMQVEEQKKAEPVEAQPIEVQAEIVPDLEMWQDLVNSATTEEELGAKYKSNKKAVDSNPDILKLFSERKAQLKTKKAA